MSTFNISDEAFPYLVTQVGELDNLKSVRRVWEAAYERNTMERLNNILPHIPDEVSSILDIGSGLGGINILLYRWFDKLPKITLLDGDTGPTVSKHNEPFNNAEVALKFMRDNKVIGATFMEYNNLKPARYDLVLSFRAWCFHIAPSVYLDYVKDSIHANSMIIVDVRKDDELVSWREQIEREFQLLDVIEDGKKHERWKLIPRSK